MFFDRVIIANEGDYTTIDVEDSESGSITHVLKMPTNPDFPIQEIENISQSPSLTKYAADLVKTAANVFLVLMVRESEREAEAERESGEPLPKEEHHDEE